MGCLAWKFRLKVTAPMFSQRFPRIQLTTPCFNQKVTLLKTNISYISTNMARWWWWWWWCSFSQGGICYPKLIPCQIPKSWTRRPSFPALEIFQGRHGNGGIWGWIRVEFDLLVYLNLWEKMTSVELMKMCQLGWNHQKRRDRVELYDLESRYLQMFVFCVVLGMLQDVTK